MYRRVPTIHALHTQCPCRPNSGERDRSVLMSRAPFMPDFAIPGCLVQETIIQTLSAAWFPACRQDTIAYYISRTNNLSTRRFGKSANTYSGASAAGIYRRSRFPALVGQRRLLRPADRFSVFSYRGKQIFSWYIKESKSWLGTVRRLGITPGTVSACLSLTTVSISHNKEWVRPQRIVSRTTPAGPLFFKFIGRGLFSCLEIRKNEASL